MLERVRRALDREADSAVGPSGEPAEDDGELPGDDPAPGGGVAGKDEGCCGNTGESGNIEGAGRGVAAEGAEGEGGGRGSGGGDGTARGVAGGRAGEEAGAGGEGAGGVAGRHPSKANGASSCAKKAMRSA